MQHGKGKRLSAPTARTPYLVQADMYTMFRLKYVHLNVLDHLIGITIEYVQLLQIAEAGILRTLN
jgi:hypothetical protein